MKTYYIVKSNPLPNKETEFNRWYDEIHIPEVLEVDGVLSAKRMELAEQQLMAQQNHRYMAVYELDSSAVEQTLENIRTHEWRDMGDSIDLQSIEASVFQSR